MNCISWFSLKNFDNWLLLNAPTCWVINNPFGFSILYSNEYYPILKFFDLGAIAYFAKIIEWEFIDFSVEKYIDKFMILQEELKEKGYIASKEHRFMIVCKKK